MLFKIIFIIIDLLFQFLMILIFAFFLLNMLVEGGNLVAPLP